MVGNTSLFPHVLYVVFIEFILPGPKTSAIMNLSSRICKSVNNLHHCETFTDLWGSCDV